MWYYIVRIFCSFCIRGDLVLDTRLMIDVMKCYVDILLGIYYYCF